MKVATIIPLLLFSQLSWAQNSFWDPIAGRRSTTPELFDQTRVNTITSRVQNADSVGIYFLGNSITHFWETDGQNVWNQYYANKYALNSGISGDRTQGVLYRFLNGNLNFKPGVHPKIAVAMIGTNNIGWDPADTPEQTAEGVRAVLQMMIRRMPYTRILLLGIFPRNGGNGNGTYNDQIAAINAELESWDDGALIHYLNIGDIFLNNNGTVNTGVMPDGLHPNAQGYTLWAQAMNEKLNELLASEPLRPIRIMPLGNSITEGTSTPEAYRFHLDGLLRRAGYHIDFVGSLKKHNNNGRDPSSYEFDIDHEGHWAKEADWLLPRVRGYAENANPDLVLLHIGTNDINHEGGSTPGEVTDRTLMEIGGIIDTLREVNPKVAVILSKIIPTTANEIPNANDVIDMLNAKMETYVEENSTSESPIVLVDQNSGFNTNTDMTDPYHPNEAGARKMAQVWMDGIATAMDPTGQIVPLRPKNPIPQKGKILQRVYIGSSGTPAKDWICPGCTRSDLYSVSGKKIFSIQPGTDRYKIKIPHRGVAYIDSY